jgi:molybdopterin-guanine dinucleotide biosynthesis protein A
MSAIVLAGGVSRRFGQDKGLVKLDEKPLIVHVLDKIAGIIDEAFVVVNSETQKMKFAEVIRKKARVVIDKTDIRTPLVGALAGFEAVQGEYALLLTCDTPFLSQKVLSFLLDVCTNKAATIPRWPNGNIEPLQAAYNVEAASPAAKTVVKQGTLDMRSMIEKMRNIRYVSTIVLQQFDPTLKTFFNVNTPSDLRKAEAINKHEAH